MAQVMQWPPAIRNYMRKVRSKYQHVIGYVSITDSKILQYKYMTCAEKTKKPVSLPINTATIFTLRFFSILSINSIQQQISHVCRNL